MSVNTAFILASIFTLFGIVILYIINPKTAMFGAISIFLYTSAYTPLKTKTPLSVFVGAIPGAIPFMLGWVAATDDFGIEPGILFMLQFFWQFPHFWSIAWILNDDYKKAGFKMLPSKSGKSSFTASIIFVYTVLLVPVVLLPWKMDFVPPIALIILAIAGIGFSAQAFRLLRRLDNKSARQLMFGSFIYLMVMQVVMVAGKFL